MIDTGAGQKKYPLSHEKETGTVRLDTQIKYCTIRNSALKKIESSEYSSILLLRFFIIY